MFTVGSCVLKTKEGRPLTQAVQEGIQESYPSYNSLDVDGAVRCDTAEIDDEMVDHWGEHWKHLKVLAASQGGKEMLSFSKYYVKKAESNDKPIINMVIVSDNGKHRSVGMADLLRHCLINFHDWEVPHVVHLGEESWQTLCRTCEHCDGERAGPWRAPAYSIALDHYANADEVVPWQARA